MRLDHIGMAAVAVVNFHIIRHSVIKRSHMKFSLLFLFFFAFVLNVFPATKTWDGGGADANWQTAANWSTDVAPVAGDDLIFPAAAPQQSNNNNFFLLTSFRSITVEGGTYTIGGNPIRLTNGLNVTTGTQTFNFAITLSGAQTFLADTGGTATIVLLSLGSAPLTIDGAGIVGIGLISGSGSVTKNGTGAAAIIAASGFSGILNHNNGIFVVDANIPSSPVNINSSAPTGTAAISGFGGTGTVGAVTVTQGVISAGTLTSPTGILNISGGLTFTANGAYVCKLGGTVAGANGHDQLNVTGSVNLNNAALAPIPWNGFRPAVGDQYLILKNDGSDAINGTFLNLPENAVFAGPLNTAFQITYHGGDGNDVSIKRIRRTPFDFDGDGKSDVSVFRPSTGVWYRLLSSNQNAAVDFFGLNRDRPTPADYDGDNKTDIAVYRPSDGTWYMLRSSDATVVQTQFGLEGDVPVANDYDGDGRSDLAVFRPSNGVWYELRSLGNQFAATQFGQSGDQTQVGDFDGDGIGDLCIFRSGVWYLELSADASVSVTNFGLAGDKPVAADYDGDGKTDIAVYRAGVWYLQQSTAGLSIFQFGLGTDVPVPGDFDGDGKADAAVYRNGIWYLQQSTSGLAVFYFGLAGDIPSQAAYSQ